MTSSGFISFLFLLLYWRYGQLLPPRPASSTSFTALLQLTRDIPPLSYGQQEHSGRSNAGRAAILLAGLHYVPQYKHRFRGTMAVDYRWSLSNYRAKLFQPLLDAGLTVDVFLVPLLLFHGRRSFLLES